MAVYLVHEVVWSYMKVHEKVLSTYVVYYLVDISVMPVDGGQLPTDKIPLGIRVPWNVHFVMMKECDHN